MDNNQPWARSWFQAAAATVTCRVALPAEGPVVPRFDASRSTILLVEDDQALGDLLHEGLTAKGYVVCLAPTAAAAEALLDSVQPHVILIDLMLPDEHGLLLCADLSQRSSAPIIVYSGTRRREDAALALKLGAADFLPKPASLQELEIRIQRALRMRGAAGVPQHPTRASLGPLVVDAARRVVTLAERELAITPTEYRLLCVLVERADQAVPVRDLGEAVWAHYDSSLDDSLKVHLRRLRAKLRTGDTGSPEIVVVRGFGYRLVWDQAPGTQTASKPGRVHGQDASTDPPAQP